MQHFTFGRNNGLRVSEVALGTGNFGTGWGYGSDLEDSRTILERFAEAGGTMIDTAASYQAGQSEQQLGVLLSGRRDDFSIATKFGVPGPAGDGPLHTGAGRRAMTRSVEGSLRRLDTDYIDLLWVHFPDGVTPLEEIVASFDDLVTAGKVLYAGLSNFPAWAASRAATIAELRGATPVSAIQFEYSLVERSADRENFPLAESLGLGAALWSPLGGGLLTGKYRTASSGRLSGLNTLVHVEDDVSKTRIIDLVIQLADNHGRQPAEVAVAWLLHRARRSSTGVVPIVGPRTPEQLETYLSALSLTLTVEEIRALDDVSHIDLGQPHNQTQAMRSGTLGGDGALFRCHPVRTA